MAGKIGPRKPYLTKRDGDRIAEFAAHYGEMWRTLRRMPEGDLWLLLRTCSKAAMLTGACSWTEADAAQWLRKEIPEELQLRRNL